MKKLVLFVFALGLFASCNPETLNNESTTRSDDTQTDNTTKACPAPDTNCNGIPDHEE